jgi:hypothetical protein
MNRVSRRSAAEAAEALLKAGRTQPVLSYDVEVGLARHHDWLRSDAPMPAWASAGVGSATKSLVPLVIKTFVSAVLVGTLAIAVWQVRARLQPSAAVVEPVTQSAAQEFGAPEAVPEPLMAPMPIPVSEQALPSEPVRRTVRPDPQDKRTARVLRAHKVGRAASAREVSATAPVQAASAQTQPATSARVETGAAASHDHGATREQAAATREPIDAAHSARAESQEPEDLVEMQQVATAEQLLERSPARALAIVRQGEQRFAHGYFRQERAYIAIMALIRLGRIDEARTRAASFADQFPALPYGARIRKALDAAPVP